MKFIKVVILSFFFLNLNAQYIVNDAFKKITLYIPDVSTSGNIGTAFETVDHYSSFVIEQTTPDITLTLPTPTDTTWGDDVTIRNIGTESFTMYGIVVNDSFDIHLTWKRGAWLPVGGYSSGGGGASGDCNCCDSLLYFDNDTAAHNQGWLIKNDYYLLSNSNTYGYPWGIIKKIKIDVGFEIAEIDNDFGILDGSVIALNEKTGFTGRGQAPCKIDPPSLELNYYESDAEAVGDGLDSGEYYLLSMINVYGLPKGHLKKITEL
jgi:hypothetical protein